MSNPFNRLKRNIRKKIGGHLQTLSYQTGMMRVFSVIRNVRGAIVLMYHSVADDEHAQWIDPRDHVPAIIFDKQMQFLSKNRKVIQLSELVDTISFGKTPEAGTIVITFDDGYLDNLTIAAPILEKYGLTATLFLPTGYIDRGENQWVDQVYATFKYRQKDILDWSEGLQGTLDLTDSVQRKTGYELVCKSLLSATITNRNKYLHDLRSQLRPSELPPKLTMTWEDVKALTTEYSCFNIGGHTTEHTDMTSVTGEQAMAEMINCMRRIEDTTDKKPQYFSFPYGRTSKKLRQLAVEAGIQSSFGGDGVDPVINADTDLFGLPRVEAPASMKNFDLLTNYTNSCIWRRIGR